MFPSYWGPRDDRRPIGMGGVATLPQKVVPSGPRRHRQAVLTLAQMRVRGLAGGSGPRGDNVLPLANRRFAAANGTFLATVLIQTSEETSPLVAIVAKAGHRVIEAHTGEEALARLPAWQPDVVILPDMAEPNNEEELLSVLRPLTGAAIIVVGKEENERIARALLLGADSYLPHPGEPQQFRSRLRSLLRRQGL